MRISTKTTIFLSAATLLVGALATGLTGACGSSSSSSSPDLTSLCNQYCGRCNNVSAGLATVAICANCSAFSGSMSKCSNESAIAQAAQACANMSTCSASESCFERSVPQCQGGGGSSGSATGGGSGGGNTGATGGAGGHATGATGGTPGSAGNGGAADCSACAKAAACCTAEAGLTNQPSISCSMLSVAQCNADGTTSTAQTCQTLVQAGAALGLAACQ